MCALLQTPGSATDDARRTTHPNAGAAVDDGCTADGVLDKASLRLHGTQAPLWARLEGKLAKGRGLLGHDPALQRLMKDSEACAAAPFMPQHLVTGAHDAVGLW